MEQSNIAHCGCLRYLHSHLVFVSNGQCMRASCKTGFNTDCQLFLVVRLNQCQPKVDFYDTRKFRGCLPHVTSINLGFGTAGNTELPSGGPLASLNYESMPQESFYLGVRWVLTAPSLSTAAFISTSTLLMPDRGWLCVYVNGLSSYPLRYHEDKLRVHLICHSSARPIFNFHLYLHFTFTFHWRWASA